MAEIIEKKVNGPVLHGVLLGNGKFITPEEIKLMISIGTVKPTKF